MEYVLQTNNLCKFYHKTKALNGLTMNVPRGAIYGLVGRNGAGKTTLIRLICGLQMPTSGEFTLFGRKHTDSEIGKSLRRMGAIVEMPAFYPQMTAEENMRQQCRILGLPSEDGIGELLWMAGLADAGKKKAGKFSSGMRQRLRMAMALVGDPDFLVLDEPMNGLDPQGIIDFRELIRKLNLERQTTVLVSGHNLDELSKIATHYGFMDAGCLVKEITAEEMESACRKCVRVEVSNIKALARTLDWMQLEYLVLSESMADIYAEVSVTELVLALAKEDCRVLTMTEHDETLESYYINMITSAASLST